MKSQEIIFQKIQLREHLNYEKFRKILEANDEILTKNIFDQKREILCS